MSNLVWCVYCTFVFVQSYAPIVNELEEYVSTNKTFAAELNSTFKEANQSNITYDDMYSMFNGWLYSVPTVNANCTVYTVLDAIITPYSDTQSGNQILRYNISTEWFYNYLNDWKTFLDSNQSAFIVPEWMKCVNMTEYIVPSGGYSSFNEFFYRAINLTYRPIANISDNSVVVSPADGFVYFIQRNISSNSIINVKNENFNITQMLNNSKYWQRFIGGDLIEIVLLFDNYHRYHHVVSGEIIDIQQIAGWYFVDYSSMFDHSQQNSNRRGVIYTKLDQSNEIIATVHTGMGEVSSVNFNVSPNQFVKKGDQVGWFAFGGSAIVILFEPGVVEHFTVREWQNIQMGQQIAKINHSIKPLQ
eukprot:265563_1